ncbi:MAG: hypothetical protein IKI93_08820, partial [Clostridia bacterium]|nr:hypothetical protein [Clostridia bacterium]
MKKQDNIGRLFAIGVIYLLIAAVYIVRLLYLQVSGQDYYTMSTPPAEYTRTVKIQAQRGEIYDRNGVPLVTNDYSYDLCLDYASKPSSGIELNEMLIDIRTIAARSGESDKLVQPKPSLNITETGSGLLFAYPENFVNTTRGKRYKKLVAQLNVKEDASIQEEAEALMYYFGIRSRESTEDGYE